MTDPATDTADVRGYLRPLRARWWIVVLIAVTAGGFSYQYYDRKPTLYSASTALLLQPNPSFAGNADPDRTAREQAIIIGTREIARQVAEELGIPRGGALPGKVTAAPSTGTDFLTLTSRSGDPRTAVELVNAYARVYVRYSGEAGRERAREARVAAQRRLAAIRATPQNRLTRLRLESRIQSLRIQENGSPFNAQQIEPALAATPIRPNPLSSAIFAFALGALLGIGLAYALEQLDRRVRRVDEIGELYDRPLLVAVPCAKKALKLQRSQLKLEPPLTEVFRTLRTTLQLQATDAAAGGRPPLRTMLVTSAIAGEGKSTVACSLALAYFDAGLRVALVDADLRRPSLAATFRLPIAPGLVEVLGGTPLEDALRVVSEQSLESSVPATAEVRPEAVAAGGWPPAVPPPPAPHMRAETERRATVETQGSRSVAGSGPPHAARLSVLTSGQAPRDPAALLVGGPVTGMLQELQADHDIVILDSSPLLPVSDAVSLLPAVEGVLVVSRMGVITRQAVGRLTDLIARVPSANVVGVVANDVRAQAGYSYGGYGY